MFLSSNASDFSFLQQVSTVLSISSSVRTASVSLCRLCVITGMTVGITVTSRTVVRRRPTSCCSFYRRTIRSSCQSSKRSPNTFQCTLPAAAATSLAPAADAFLRIGCVISSMTAGISAMRGDVVRRLDGSMDLSLLW